VNGIISGTFFEAGNFLSKEIISKICVLCQTARKYKNERKRNYKIIMNLEVVE
jgi:hypothetical protein